MFKILVTLVLTFSFSGSAFSAEIPEKLNVEKITNKIFSNQKTFVTDIFSEEGIFHQGKLSGDEACTDIYKFVCHREEGEKPIHTSSFLPTSEQVDHSKLVLDDLISKFNTEDMTTKEIDQVIDEYTELEKFPEMLELWDAQLKKVKDTIWAIWPDKIGKHLLASRLNDLRIEKNYSRSKEFLFTFKLHTISFNAVKHRINVGEFLLKNLTNEDTIFFLLSHEMGHVVAGINRFVAKPSPAANCDTGDLEKNMGLEALADEWAWKIFSHKLEREGLEKQEYMNKVKNAGSIFCGNPGSDRGHPTGLFRIEFIMNNKNIHNKACSGLSEEVKSVSEKKYSQYMCLY